MALRGLQMLAKFDSHKVATFAFYCEELTDISGL